MIAVDTNVLVRLITDDDRELADRAARLFEAESVVFVPQIVVCELVWVLTHAYGFDRGAVHDAVRDLVDAKQVLVEEQEEVRRALGRYEARGDLADHLILERARRAGCTRVATFDKKLPATDPGFYAP